MLVLEVYRLEQHGGAVFFAAFRRKGRRLAEGERVLDHCESHRGEVLRGVSHHSQQGAGRGRFGGGGGGDASVQFLRDLLVDIHDPRGVRGAVEAGYHHRGVLLDRGGLLPDDLHFSKSSHVRAAARQGT